MEKFLIGVDFGGTNVRMGLITPKGKIVKKIQYETDISKGKSILFDHLILNIKDLIIKELKKANQLLGIGIGIAGAIDIKKGILHNSPNLPELKEFNIKDFLKKKISFPLAIENDANAFILGEGWMGAAKGSNHYCGLTLGTGVGGGIVVNGKILHGSEGMGGEVGHMVIDPEGPLCGCGGKGCLETFASGTAIKRMALEAMKKGKGGEILNRNSGYPKSVTSEIVYKAAKSGDITAQKIFDEMGRYLGLGLVNLIHLFNPEKIVIGGRVSGAWYYFIKSTRETIKERSMKGPREKVEIIRAECGDDAGILGAAYTALYKFK